MVDDLILDNLGGELGLVHLWIVIYQYNGQGDYADKWHFKEQRKSHLLLKEAHWHLEQVSSLIFIIDTVIILAFHSIII